MTHRAVHLRLLALLVVLLSATGAGLFWWQLERAQQVLREQAVAQAQKRSLQLADAMAGQMGSLLRTADLALQQLRREWGGGREGFAATARSVLGAFPPGAVTHLSVVGADGYVAYNTLDVAERTYVGDREHFRVHAESGGADRVFIGKPVMSRLFGAWTFFVTRPILRDGRFDGMVALSMSAEFVSTQLAQLELSPHDVMALLHADGTFYARAPDFLKAMGGAVPRDRPFLAPDSSARGSYRAPGALDQAPRIYAWRRIEPYGLIQAVGLDEATVLAPLAQGLEEERLRSGVVVALVLAFGGTIAALLLQVARRQHDLAASEARYRRLHESMAEAHAQFDLDGRLMDWNPAFQEMLGYAADDLGRLGWADLTPERWREQEAGILRDEVLARGSSGVYEKECLRRDGSAFPVEVRVFLLRSERGAPQGMWALVRDISKRREAEAALRRAQFLLDNAPQEIWLARLDGTLVYANPAAAQSLGRTVEELRGMTVADVGPVGGPDFSAHARAMKAGQGAAPPFETEHLTRDGRRVPKEVRATYLKLGGEEYICGFVTDISQRKRDEAALRQLNEELEQRVEARTRELAESNARLRETVETLERARDELVRSEKLASLGSLVAGVAHELSTPLGNGLTVATTLEERVRAFAAEVGAGSVRRSSLNDFLAQAERAAALLTRNLFNASELIGHFKQVAVDQTSAQRRQFDLAQVVGEVVDTLQPRFKRTPHRIVLAIPPGLGMDSYPGPLGQVVTNLVLNALIHGFDASRPGVVTLAAEPLGNDWVRLKVADDGRGIAPEHLARVFDPFFTTRLGQGGSGLGLHIVYSLVSRVLGGRIEAGSPPGGGAEFTVELPLNAPVQESAEHERRPSAAEPTRRQA